MRTFKEFSKIMKFRYLPNVSQMEITKTGVNPYALVYGIHKTYRELNFKEFREIKHHNLYLRRQYARLYNLAIAGEIDRFERLALTLIKHSRIYQLCMLHHASRDWSIRKYRLITKIWRRISTISKSMDANLKYERWWIDKKPGDYGRPIGAPKLWWKCHLLKYLQILEIFYRSREIQQNWQHAGISRKGLVTAWRDVLLKVLNHRYIYEFDLRGFFDRISNQDALKELPLINNYFNRMSNSKPSKYHLPGRDQDTAAPYLSYFREVAQKEGTRGRSLGPARTNSIKIYWQETARELGRDHWKGLGAPNHGFPQGANTSPFMSTLVLSKAIGACEGLTMYMDDGFIYAHSEKELYKRIANFKEKIATIGLSIAEEKSSILRLGEEHINTFRFLGIRHEDRDFRSETRKGTTEKLQASYLEFDVYDRWGVFYNIPEEVSLAAWMSAHGHDLGKYLMEGTKSEKRIKSWIVNKATDKTAALRWAINHGFMSNIIANSFNPNMDENELRITEGICDKFRRIYESRGFSRKVLEEWSRRGKPTLSLDRLSTQCVRKLLKRMRRRKNSRQFRSNWKHTSGE